jgi:hypothetical protein
MKSANSPNVPDRMCSRTGWSREEKVQVVQRQESQAEDFTRFDEVVAREVGKSGTSLRPRDRCQTRPFQLFVPQVDQAVQ